MGMKTLFTAVTIFICGTIFSQSSIKGQLLDVESNPVLFSNVALYSAVDSSMVKVETTNENGEFKINGLSAGNYFLKATFVGLPDLVIPKIQLAENEEKDLAALTFKKQAEELKAFTITEERAMVEVKPDRTVFNVQGTINSTGSDAITLLRKAPSVQVDNNDNINVLGRSGVRVYIDGKQLPLAGEDLSNYLKNLSADQIDKIEIITNPGAKYEAEGNAGIIDIRLKKDDTVGANGSLGTTFTQGELTRYNINANGNYRNKKLNVFGSYTHGVNDNFHNIDNRSYQNGLYMEEINDTRNNRNMNHFRLGSDFFLHKNHTVGFLVMGGLFKGEEIGYNRITIADEHHQNTIDSILVANNNGDIDRKNQSYNLNYRFYNKKGQSLNVDFDYGNYTTEVARYQPNTYYDASEEFILSQSINSFETPTDIGIYTAKADYETNFLKGKLGLGAKYSLVETNNTFKIYDVVNGNSILDNTQSNQFDYDENVYAGYISYAHPLGKKFNLIVGLRAEQTEAEGVLTAFAANLNQPPVKQSYLSLFPNAGVSWKFKKKQSFNLNYGRRINRPDYNVLNPFRTQLSELSIATGNPFLKPEIVNNLELGYTLNYKYNFKVAYSRTDDKITRLIGPDPIDVRANFVSWDNLATETVTSFSASLPMKIKKWWQMFTNLSANYIDNQADYGNGAVVDVQNFGYTIYQQNTFNLFKGIKAELSGYYSGPGVWGGVFKYEANWSVGAGLQKEFFKKKLKARVAANNIFNRINWRGVSEYNGLKSYGEGMFDSHFISFSLNYNFGNQKLNARKRKTGIESESKRVGG